MKNGGAQPFQDSDFQCFQQLKRFPWDCQTLEITRKTDRSWVIDVGDSGDYAQRTHISHKPTSGPTHKLPVSRLSARNSGEIAGEYSGLLRPWLIRAEVAETDGTRDAYLLAIGELNAGYHSAPSVRIGAWQILARNPKGAVIRWVYADAAVIPPPISHVIGFRRKLRPLSRHQSFLVSHGPW